MRFSSIFFIATAASLGLTETIGRGGTWIDSLLWIRVLNANGISLPRLIVSVIFGRRSRHCLISSTRALDDDADIETTSRNFWRNCRRVVIAYNIWPVFIFVASASTISWASWSSLVKSERPMFSSNPNDAEFVATSSSYQISSQWLVGADFVNVPPLQFSPNVVRAFDDCKDVRSQHHCQ